MLGAMAGARDKADKAAKVKAGEWLREARTSRDISARDFARQIDVTVQQLSRYEIGDNAVDDDRAALIAKALGVPVVVARRGLGLWVPDADFGAADLTEEELAIELGRRFGIDPAELRGIVRVWVEARRASEVEVQGRRISQSDNDAASA
jgi:transcriptional regulator with XRE-family HTH domain